jgi:predicted lipid carrier protein YhbT
VLEQLRARIVRQGPSLLRVPLKFTPFALQRQLLEQVLGWQFRQALADGDLEFLESRWLKIEVRDLALHWFMTVENDKLVVSQHAEADVSFSGDANFQRRLQIEGDTELGLYVKNLMDAIELEAMPAPLRIGLLQLAEFVEAGLQEGTVQTSRVPATC